MWLVGLLALMLWLVFVWKERSAFSTPKFFVHLSISLVAIVSLAMMALKPVLSIPAKSFKAVLLTEDYNETQLDSLKKEHKRLAVYQYAVGEPILHSSEVPESFFILGNGIKHFDLWQLDAINTTYLGENDPTGIIQLKYDLENKVGNRAIIEGRYNNAKSGHKLVLLDPSETPLDSLLLSSEKNQDFTLSMDLKVKGTFVFQLLEKDSLGTVITKDPLPISVSDQNKLNILIVNDFPAFETKYVKNYLAEKGHRVLSKSGLTKDRYKFEYFNMDSKPLVDFTEEGLNHFDLVFIDVSSLKKLSRTKRNALESAVREQGLGLFIQPDASFRTATIPLSTFNFTSSKSTQLVLDAWPKVKVPSYPFTIKSAFEIQPIHTEDAGILSAYIRSGQGRIGTSVFQNTFELVLNGDVEAYQELWAAIIENISKKDMPSSSWSTKAPLVFQDEPFTFQLRTQENIPLVTTDENALIPMVQDIDISSLWEGVSYPKRVGWNKHRLQEGTSFNYYVVDSVHWKAMDAQAIINDNKRHFGNNSIIKNTGTDSKRPINPLWFLFVFMACTGYLWLAPRLPHS